jgi:hypothetical protein
MKGFSAIVIIALLLPTVPVVAGPVGLGVSGGALAPVSQEDESTGAIIGVKIRADLPGPFVAEPNIYFGSFGSADIAGIGTRDGSSLNHYGLDITLGDPMARMGFKPYFLLGGAVYNRKRDGDLTTNKSGWSFGGGGALGIRQDLDIDIRGRFNIVSWEGSSSKKSFEVTIGATYYVGLK